GSVLVPSLLQRGHSVTVIDRFTFGQTSLTDCCWYETFRIVRGDCRDRRTMSALVAYADVIIPLAALVGAPVCDRDPYAAQSTNEDAVKLLCQLASKDQWVVLPTTNSGYGIGEAGIHCTEETPLRPISLYGRTKVGAERAVLDRENSVSFRLATVFGMSP